ncbi:MAG: PASTA domain-containing protein [Spirochaetaceae bacterium]|jgi:cell division protein FtsI (penicillin-binding protein 3)|nr:PASTA domain-containing protein [Spirochaetaceae bacterium]
MFTTTGRTGKRDRERKESFPSQNRYREQYDPGRLYRRFLAVFFLFSLLTLMVVLRYALLMLTANAPETLTSPKVFTERGAILDRNGRILAMQTRLANISVWRPEIKDLQALSETLSPLLNLSRDEIIRRITTASSDFLYLKKQVDQATIQKIRNQLPGGVNIEPIVGRIYPESNLASQIIGFVGDEGMGLEGIEYAFESELAPNGERDGNQVLLTIDANVQYILETIASQTLRENKAEAVMLLALDPRSGEILGSASEPGYNPNALKDSDEISRMNRPVIWAYEPGSVFKVFSLAALLDSGAITGNSTFICNGRYERVTNLGERVLINCLGAHGTVSAREIIRFSCNAGAAYAADRLSAEAFYKTLQDFGFGSRVGAGSPGETAGLFRSVDRWSARSKPTMAMGQEISVSALQMIQAASAVANDGILIPPRIVSRIRSADGSVERAYNPGTPRRILKAETTQLMRSYMMDVTSSTGTGRRANMEDLSLAVKTGTAQYVDPTTGAYSSSDFIASCMALLPSDEPSLILYIVIIKPQGESYLGGRIAAPPIRQAAEALVDYLGIPRGRNPQVRHSGSITLPQEEIPLVEGKVPNLTGYAKRQLLPLLLRDDLHLEIRGDGWVKRQSPAPGTPLKADTTIIVELE